MAPRLYARYLFLEHGKQMRELYSHEEMRTAIHRLEGLERAMRQHPLDLGVATAVKTMAPVLLGVKPTITHPVFEGKRDGNKNWSYTVGPRFRQRLDSFFSELEKEGIDARHVSQSSRPGTKPSRLFFFTVPNDLPAHFRTAFKTHEPHHLEALEMAGLSPKSNAKEIQSIIDRLPVYSKNRKNPFNGKDYYSHQIDSLYGIAFGYPKSALDAYVGLEASKFMLSDEQYAKARKEQMPLHYVSENKQTTFFAPEKGEAECNRWMDRIELANALVEKLVRHYHPEHG